MTYDQNNIFAKVLRGELPNTTVYEDDHVLAFKNIHPQAPVHVMMIPKGAYTDIDDFHAKATDDEIVAFSRALPVVTKTLNLNADGFRVISNCGADGGQEIAHYHIHILGGTRLGALVQDGLTSEN